MMRQEDKAYLDEVARGIRAALKANSDLSDMRFDSVEKSLDELVAHQKKQNNRLDKLEKGTGIAQWCQRNQKLAVIIVILSWFVISIFAELVHLRDIILMFK